MRFGFSSNRGLKLECDYAWWCFCRLTSRQRRPVKSKQKRRSLKDSSRKWRDLPMYFSSSVYWKISELTRFVPTFVPANMALWLVNV